MSDPRHIKADQLLWQGRKVDSQLPPQYWYQKIELHDPESEVISKMEKTVGIVGYACDEGVRRNQGREGAAKGPNAIRERLAKMAFHHDDLSVLDYGDIVTDKDMESGQKLLGIGIHDLLRNRIFPIVLGGGHDVAFGHYMGIAEYLNDVPDNRLGIINIDAHFDLRMVEDLPNSGTPFFQIHDDMNRRSRKWDYFVLGIQPPSNTPQLFDTAHRLHTKYILSEDCTMDRLRFVKGMLSSFLDRNDVIYLSIDMDAFSSAYAPGVSAPSPLGLSPHFVFEVVAFLMKSVKVVSCDIAEMNPDYDKDGSTAILAARIVDRVSSFI